MNHLWASEEKAIEDTLENTKYKLRFSLTDPTEPVPIDQLIKLQSAIRLFDTKYDDLNNRLSEYLSYPDYMQVRHCECRSAVDCFYQIDGYINDISSLLETFDSQKQVVELVADLSRVIERLITTSHEESQMPTKIARTHEKLLTSLTEQLV
ncbi:hypothetical protein FBUS_01298 [Fasciolopsis buskii]|uniref:Uncharacterized protein n=1 Tax=Fasciolopsis buskii TaxID=27845 RepID=A0A8E0S313_9TREM|nr:hypothetical protein FBUS_01298 [Fasciolopsis buski]